jgi:microcystin-dependent protein
MEEMLGSIKMFAGSFAPNGWIFCHGQLLNIMEHQALYSLLGTTYGGNGRTTFGVPDLRGRVPIGSGTGPGLTPKNPGFHGGHERVALSTSEMPNHSHTAKCDTATGGRQLTNTPSNNLCATDAEGNSYGANPSDNMSADMIQPAGGNQAHENMQPWLCINFILCTNGYYPTRS